jgi:CheY-like chemotaxis protein
MVDPLAAHYYIRTADYDVPFVILDLKMPGFTGREAVMFIRQVISESTLLALVSGDRQSIRALGLSATRTTCLFTKPVDAEAIVDFLQSGTGA